MPTSDFMIKLKDIATGKEKETTKKQNELQNINTTFTNNKMKIEKLVDRLAEVDKDIMPEVAEQIRDLKNKNTAIEDRINELKIEVENETDQRKVAALALDMITRYMDTFDKLDIISKRTLIKLLISSVESDGENIYINFIESSSTSKCPRCESSRCNTPKKVENSSTQNKKIN